MKNIKKHRPPHYFSDDTIYFITSAVYHKKPLFNSKSKKSLLKNIIKEKAQKFKIKIFAFVILDNHYHILFKIEKGINLPIFIREVNGKSALMLNKIDKMSDRAVWYNYWDECASKEKDFWVRFNYIHHNPVKHKYVKNMEDYDFSSYGYWLDKKGEYWISDVFESYPIIDFSDSFKE